jgi:hypothetical protein
LTDGPGPQATVEARARDRERIAKVRRFMFEHSLGDWIFLHS